jgi:hypothetical protein
MRSALGLALGFVLVLMLGEAAAAAPHFPSALAQRWCGTEKASDFKPGWFPQARPQIKVVYAYATDQKFKFHSFSHLIQGHIKRALEMVGDESKGRRSIAIDLGTECGPRYVDIASVPLKHDSKHYDDLNGLHPRPGGRSAEIQMEVRTALGLDPNGASDKLGLGGKRNFAVFVNMGSVTPARGLARGDLPGCPMGGADPSCQPDDQPGPGNKANEGGYWAWVFDLSFLEQFRVGRLAMLHEITHNFGAVQDSAQHSTIWVGRPRGHCTDGLDVMCLNELTPRPCSEEIRYDCNKDDYFNPSGPILDMDGRRIWNVANSVFTCPYYSSPSERGCAPQAAADDDFNGDGRADLAVGVPDEDVGTKSDAGAVNVLYGGVSGLSSSRNQFWTQDSPGVREVAEPDDNFGYSLAAGDFSGDGFADLAVGVPGEDLATQSDAGAVNVLKGGAPGLSGLGDELWTQDSPGVREVAESDDVFGDALTAADFSGDGFAELAVGVPGEDLATQSDAGAVNVLKGGALGLSGLGDEFWTQDSPGEVEDVAEANDLFGLALAD